MCSENLLLNQSECHTATAIKSRLCASNAPHNSEAYSSTPANDVTVIDSFLLRQFFSPHFSYKFGRFFLHFFLVLVCLLCLLCSLIVFTVVCRTWRVYQKSVSESRRTHWEKRSTSRRPRAITVLDALFWFVFFFWSIAALCVRVRSESLLPKMAQLCP